MRHDFKREKTSEYTRRRRAKRNARVYLVPFDVDIVVRLCFFLDVVLCCKNQNENSRRLRWTSQRRRLGRSPKLIRFFSSRFCFRLCFGHYGDSVITHETAECCREIIFCFDVLDNLFPILRQQHWQVLESTDKRIMILANTKLCFTFFSLLNVLSNQ